MSFQNGQKETLSSLMIRSLGLPLHTHFECLLCARFCWALGMGDERVATPACPVAGRVHRCDLCHSGAMSRYVPGSEVGQGSWKASRRKRHRNRSLKKVFAGRRRQAPDTYRAPKAANAGEPCRVGRQDGPKSRRARV